MNISSRTVVKVLGITALFVGMLLAAYMLRIQLVWMGTAFFLSVALNPSVEQLRRLVRSRSLAVASVFLLAGALLAFLLVALVPPLIHQSERLAQNLPHYTDELVNGHSVVSEQIRNYHLVDRVKNSQTELIRYVSSAGGSFFSVLQRLFASFAAGLTILVLTIFMLLEGPHWVEAFWRVVPEKRRVHGRELAGEMYKAVTGYVLGYLLMSLFAASITAILLTILGVPYAVPLGILVGIFDWLPLVGATIGAAVVVIAALFSSNSAGLVMLIFFLIYQQVENHVLQPLVQGRTVKMSPLLVLVSVLVGVGLGGFLGAIVAIPVGASVQILARDLARHRLAIRR
ncbi:MAG TPA: AI-2E family transporter [Candidatus Saccharimonadia bacterium]|nr:AI-2E family transporter [Candidatus Saccharimonadia bacterium]